MPALDFPSAPALNQTYTANGSTWRWDGTAWISANTLPIEGGGTNASTAQGARTNLLPAQSGQSGKYLSTNGTDVSWADIVQSGGTVTSVSGTGSVNGITLTGTVTSSGSLTLGGALSGVDLATQTSGTLSVARGGTGATDAATARSNLGAGTVASVSGTGTVSGLTLSGTVTSTGNLTLGGTLSVTPSNFASQTANTFLAAPNGAAGVPTFRAIVAADIPTLNQNTTGTASNVTGTVAVVNGGTGATTAANARTNLGATTVGASLFTLTNPSAITFPRFNADNTVSALDAATFRTAIGAGTGNGTVTSVSGAGTVNGLTLSGSITSSGSLTLGGTLSGVSLTTQVSGTLPVANGGTGATTLTGYVRGSGTSALTASSTIPVADVTGAASLSADNVFTSGLNRIQNTTAALQFWKDGTPTLAGRIGFNTQVSDGLSLDTFNGTSWRSVLNANATGNVTIPAPASGVALTVNGTTDFMGSVQSNVVTLASSAVDCTQGNYFTRTVTGATSWTISNAPSSRAYSFIIELTNGGLGAQTWFANTRWPGGTAPTLTSSGVDVLGFITDDGGANWRGVLLMKDSK